MSGKKDHKTSMRYSQKIHYIQGFGGATGAILGTVGSLAAAPAVAVSSATDGILGGAIRGILVKMFFRTYAPAVTGMEFFMHFPYMNYFSITN